MARALPVLLAAAAAAALFVLALGARGAAPHASIDRSRHGGKKHGGKKGGAHSSPFCRGPSCQAMSDLLPRLAFAEGEGPTVFCSCADFAAGSCFAPGCSVCDPSCFGDPAVAKLPGPFGTGLLCSSGCHPCCQAPDDPTRVEGSTCELPPGGCPSA